MSGINKKVLMTLKEQLQWDDKIILEVIASYLESAPEHLAKIKLYLSQKNIAGMAKEVHPFKSSSRTLGAEILGDICQKLEDLKNSQDLAAAAELFLKIDQEYENVAREYKEMKVISL